MNKTFSLTAGALLAAIGVALGAVGAHAWKELLAENGRTETYELAVRYHLFHAFALLFNGLLMHHKMNKLIQASSTLFLSGLICFSGSLYLLALSGTRFMVYVTPLGGVLMIAGWIILAAGILKQNPE
jgi:uncharacterized membrane protein YgdD (TMEM256/DUF423 family)